MGDVSRTVGGTLPNYATWTLFEAAIPADITLATGTNEHWIGKGRDAAFNEAFAISGITTDSTNRVTFTYDTGAKHDGRSRDVSGSGCQISASSGGGGVVRPAIQHFSIIGIEVKQAHVSTPYPAISWAAGTYSSGANDQLIDSCILQNTSGSGATYLINASVANLVVDIKNTIGYSYGRTADFRNSATVAVNYCTFWRHTDQLGILGDTELTTKNTYVGKASGSAEDFWTGGAAPSGSNNASSDTTATTDYTSSLVSKAGSNQFVSVTAGSEDFTLKSGSDLETNGVSIGGITTDIIGTSRDGSTPDIGAFEFVAGGTNVLATTDALTLTEQQAIVNAETNISATTDTLAITEYAATINAETNVQAGTDALTLTEQTATVNAETNIQTAVDALILTEHSATITLVTGVNVLANTDVLTLTENSATVNAARNVQASTDTLILTELAATVSIGLKAVQIDGANQQEIASNYGDLTLYFNGSNYFTI